MLAFVWKYVILSNPNCPIKNDDSVKRIDNRIAELNRQNEEQSLKSNVGNSAESHPKDGYLPDDSKTAGAQSVAPPLCKTSGKKVESNKVVNIVSGGTHSARTNVVSTLCF